VYITRDFGELASMTKRKTIPPKLKLKVLKRDKHKCQICGKSPSTDPELELEVDHILPVSKGGTNELDNLQTLCIYCNRGKGNDDSLNIEMKERINDLLYHINPEILKQLEHSRSVRVVANNSEYAKLVRLLEIHETYRIKLIPNTIIGYHAGFNMGIYTNNDSGGTKINFEIRKRN